MIIIEALKQHKYSSAVQLAAIINEILTDSSYHPRNNMYLIRVLFHEQECQLYFPTAASLGYHIGSKHKFSSPRKSDRTLNCQFCPENFVKLCAYTRHVNSVHQVLLALKVTQISLFVLNTNQVLANVKLMNLSLCDHVIFLNRTWPRTFGFRVLPVTTSCPTKQRSWHTRADTKKKSMKMLTASFVI